jgi:hypothetical protein
MLPPASQAPISRPFHGLCGGSVLIPAMNRGAFVIRPLRGLGQILTDVLHRLIIRP